MATNRNLFPPNRSPKLRESQLLSFGLRLVRKIFEETITTCNPNQSLWKIFSSNKARQPIGRKDSIQTVNLTSRRLDSFLYEAVQNFEVFSNIQKWIEKIKKHIAVDVLFKAYPMVPLSCRSNLAERYLEVGGRDNDGGVSAGRRHRRRHLDGGAGGLASGSRQHQLICEKKRTYFSYVFLRIPYISYMLFFLSSPPACCLTARIISTRSSGVR